MNLCLFKILKSNLSHLRPVIFEWLSFNSNMEAQLIRLRQIRGFNDVLSWYECLKQTVDGPE